jgi:hypothetical protein
VLAPELTSPYLHQALRARRTYATTGVRIAVRFACGAHTLGDELPPGTAPRFEMEVRGTEALSTVELLRDGRTLNSVCPGGRSLATTWEDPEPPAAPSWYMLRVTQEDGNRAWTTPIWFPGVG